MAKYRPIKTSIWDDEYILSLKTDEKLFFVYLITNNYTSLCGIYTLSIRYAEMATGIPKKRILEILEKFKIDNKAIYHNGWVRVVNTQKHQNPSPHIMTGIKREEANIPLEIKDTLYRIHTLPYSMDKPIPKPIPKPELKLELKATAEFEKFWEMYPKKKSKGDAIRAWNKLTAQEHEKIISVLPEHSKQEGWQKEGGKYIPYPASWLNARGWEDEISKPKTYIPPLWTPPK